MTRPFLIAAILCPSLCLAQPAGGLVIDRIEARVEQLRESLDKHAAESRRINDRLDRWEARLDRFDGSLIIAFFKPFWLILTGLYRLTWGLIAALIAVCVARTVREVSDAIVAWKTKPT
jgi:hypothetical protein